MLMDILDSTDSLYPYTHTSIDGTINHDPGDLEGAFHALSDSVPHYNLCSGGANTSGLITPTLTNRSTWLDAPDETRTGAATPTALALADLQQSSLEGFQPRTTALQRPAEADPPRAGAGDSHRRWLLKIIDINVQLFNHLQASTGPSGPLRNRDQLRDRSGPRSSRSSTLDDAIGLSMRLFELLRELSDLYGEETDGQSTPYDEEMARRGGGGAEGPTCPLDPGSVLMILSSYMRVLEALSDLLQAVNQSTADGASAHARLDLPMITLGATTLNQHPRLCLVVFLETVEYMLGSMSEHLGCIVRSTGRSLRAGSGGIVSWRLGGSLESSLRDFRNRFYSFLRSIRPGFRTQVAHHGGLSIFTLGSGISGGANSTAMLIAGRLVQGLGGAGIGSMTNLIISDLVSVRERGKYQGIIFGTFGIGISIGPVIGGAIAQSGHWRWVFWLNLPLGGVTLLLQLIFLQITYRKIFTFKQKIKQIDWIGNLLLIGSMVAILIALSWADTRYAWSSWHILVPLLVGFGGMFAFHAFEATKWCKVPTIPGRLFTNRTSAVCLINTFLSSMLTFWRVYFLPLYFQGVLLASPQRSGVLLPSVLTAAPAAILSGFALSRWGRYKPIHLSGYALMTLATGLYIDLDAHSSMAKIVIYQIIAGVGGGILLTTFLPAVQGALPQSDVAPASTTWAYLRAFGSIWGIAIPAAIFNSRFAYHARAVSDEGIRRALSGGNAYAHVSNRYISGLPQETRDEVVGAYLAALKNVWQVCIGFCGLAFLLTLLEKEIPMRTTVQSDYGLKEKKGRGGPGIAEGKSENQIPVVSGGNK
ncbi:putative MFS transporter [Aspergillus fischeri NRRL 181]|uniref:MFS transporter, putative n=1 Tax=Neosartorya fischeri (strain ATCC 1020 / DSM 3700 / CBS 544.65 / FGSC A1164 / JCM 1740 / NRRL 181 / WB 181) TaxID=331117 RepID=A1DBM1_NEOFI|nr:MFS transporter, putative [Aspergillus fischeri NRRL 181]EAW20261.1 MFS transporter, putative [Aspergillus fischeri NRRL 181]